MHNYTLRLFTVMAYLQAKLTDLVPLVRNHAMSAVRNKSINSFKHCRSL